MRNYFFLSFILMLFVHNTLYAHEADRKHAKREDGQLLEEFVEASSTRILLPGQKIVGTDFERVIKPYTIQRLSKRVYWVEVQMYHATVVVGDETVMVIDPMSGGRAAGLIAAIQEITPKPVSTVVYSHSHVDHISDTPVFMEDARSKGLELQIIATELTKSELIKYKSNVPLPNVLLEVPYDEFEFEGVEIKVGTPESGHTVDNSWFLLEEEKILHFVDVVNPTHLEFERFGFPQEFLGYEKGLKRILDLDWNILNAGHMNIGSKNDVRKVLSFIADVKNFTAQVLQDTDFFPFVNPVQEQYSWIDGHKKQVASQVVELLRPKWGNMIGFDTVAQSQVEVIYWEIICRQ